MIFATKGLAGWLIERRQLVPGQLFRDPATTDASRVARLWYNIFPSRAAVLIRALINTSATDANARLHAYSVAELFEAMSPSNCHNEATTRRAAYRDLCN